MPYVRVWIHFVLSTKNREPIMKKPIRESIFTHMEENAKAKNIYLDCVDGSFDHVHALIALKPDQSISKVAQLLKGESSHWANETRLTPGRFEWQEEYFAVSVSDSLLDQARAYIRGQEEHHKKSTFAEEYQQFLKDYGFAIEG